MKVKDIIPIIDDVIAVYNKNRAVILMLGDTDVEKIAALVQTIKGIIKK